MKATLFLVTLVAACLLSGCGTYWLNGQCNNGGFGPYCALDGQNEYGADSSTNGTDMTVSGSDASSSPETAVDVAVVCDPKLAIVVGFKWHGLNPAYPEGNGTAQTPGPGYGLTQCGVDFLKWFWSPQEQITIHDATHIKACLVDGSECWELERDDQ